MDQITQRTGIALDNGNLPCGTSEGDIAGPELKEFTVSQQYLASITVTRTVEASSEEQAIGVFHSECADLADDDEEQVIDEVFHSIEPPEVEEV